MRVTRLNWKDRLLTFLRNILVSLISSGGRLALASLIVSLINRYKNARKDIEKLVFVDITEQSRSLGVAYKLP